MSDISEPILHGPTKTRLGTALLVDLTAPQRNMVLERGSHLPRASLVVTSAARRIIELSKAGEKVESLVVLGSQGDPTIHPDLREITENLKALRGKWFPRAKMYLLSESLAIDSPDLRQILMKYDRLYWQFEWGTAKTFSSLTGEKGTLLAALTKDLSYFDHLIVQANFVRGDLDNSTASEVKSWIKKLQEVKPLEILISTSASTAGGKKVKAITPARRQQIADEVAEATGVAVSLFDGERLLV